MDDTPRVSRAVKIGIGALAAMGLMCVGVAVIHRHLDKELESELAALRAAGIAVTLEEAAAAYIATPPETNALVHWLAAGKQWEADMKAADSRRASIDFWEANRASMKAGYSRRATFQAGDQELFWFSSKLLPLRVPFLDGVSPLAFGEPLSGPVREASLDQLAASETVLRLVHQAAAVKECRLDLSLAQGFDLVLPVGRIFLHGSRLLRLQAAVAARDGNLDEALACAEAGFMIGDHLADEPVDILVRAAAEADFNALGALRDAMCFGSLDEASLLRLQQRLLAKADAVSIHAALQTEFCTWRSWFIDPNSLAFDQSGYGYWVTMVYAMPGVPESWMDPIAKVAHGCLSAAVPFFEADHLDYVRYYGELIRILRGPASDWWTEAQAWETRIESLPETRVVTRRNAEISVYLVRLALRRRALLFSAATALAAERYRLANGSPPTNLQALVPEWLDSVPEDPFVGAPLQYRADRDALWVYSLGPNGKEDVGYDDEVFRVVIHPSD